MYGLGHAQSGNFAAVEGIVSDEAESPLPGVVVRLDAAAEPDTTDASGRFAFRDVPYGRHVLIAERSGSVFMPFRKNLSYNFV